MPTQDEIMRQIINLVGAGAGTALSDEVQDAPAFSGPLGGRTYDDLFEAPPGAQFRAGDVAVRFGEGARWAQVFAPAGEELIAFEPMAAPTDALVTGDDLPCSPYTMRFAIEIA